jgi:ferric-dicitrate binding protein FerR (iron transport regulator)
MSREKLFDKHLRGELTERDAAELKELLRRDADTGRALVDYVNETSLMVRVGSQIQSALLPGKVSELVDKPDMARRRRSYAWERMALAACLVAFAIVAARFGFKPPPPPGSEGKAGAVELVVQGATEVQRGSERLRLTPDFELEPGDVITTATNAKATLHYANEPTQIEVQPGSAVRLGELVVGKEIELRRGSLQARVAPQPKEKPMLVTTPHARATVLGTEFIVQADAAITRLDVLEGKVQLACRANAKKVVVRAGYSATSDSHGPSKVSPCEFRQCLNTNKLSKEESK